MPPRRKKKSAPQTYASVDTPEIVALATGYARQGYYGEGYDRARVFGNELVMNATAVPAKQKAQIAFLAGRYGESAQPFLQPITGVNLQKELGLNRHYLDVAFDKNITKTTNGLQYSTVHGLDLMRAYKLPGAPKPPAAPKPRHPAIADDVDPRPPRPIYQEEINELFGIVADNKAGVW